MLTALQSTLWIVLITFAVTQQLDNNIEKKRLKANSKKALPILQ